MKNEKIIKICEQKFIYLNYSKRTQDNYMSHIKRFIESKGTNQQLGGVMVNTYGNQSVIFRQVRNDTGSNPVLATVMFGNYADQMKVVD